VETWNEHRIRPQKQRPNHAAGIPNDLYTDRSLPRYGWIPDIEFLSQLTEAVKDVGKQLELKGKISINQLERPRLLFIR